MNIFNVLATRDLVEMSAYNGILPIHSPVINAGRWFDSSYTVLKIIYFSKLLTQFNED